MSLKSFDKFCESIINPDTESQKEIFDERQNIIRSKLMIEALLIYAGMTLINCIIMELFYKWAESQFSSMLLIMALCLLYWLIRCVAKGCIVSASGKQFQKNSTLAVFIGCGVFLIRFLLCIGEEGFPITDGKFSDDFVFMLSLVIMILCGIIKRSAIYREEKRIREEQNEH